MRRVLEALSSAGLHLKAEKCHFHKTEVKYLGLIISANGIQMDPEKVTAILEWGLPRNLHDVRVRPDGGMPGGCELVELCKEV